MRKREHGYPRLTMMAEEELLAGAATLVFTERIPNEEPWALSISKHHWAQQTIKWNYGNV